MKARALCVALAAVVVTITACIEMPTGVDRLIVTFEVSADTVQPGDSLHAKLVIYNPTSRTVTLTSGCSAVASVVASKDGQGVPLVGANGMMCLTVMTDFNIGPNQQLERIYPLVAMFENLSLREYTAAPPGTYQLHLRPLVAIPDQIATFHVAGTPD
jgi:hypothetical protein